MKRVPCGTRIILALLCILLVAASRPAAADEVQDKLERFLQQTQTPGMALSAMRIGDAEPKSWHAGLADIELNVPVDRSTTFRVGSVTKLFTAAATMKLVKDGQLSLSTTMDRYFPSLPGASKITVAYLLDHASGLPDMLSIEPFAGNMAKAYTPEEILDMVIKKGTLDFEPGERAEYSNTGYLVLGLLIEKVSGRSYNDFLQQSVVAPLAMDRTGLGTDQAIVPWRAAGYTIENDAAGKSRVLNAQWVSIIPPFSTGAVLSRPADFIRLINMDDLLDSDTVKKMMKPGKVAHDKAKPLKTGLGDTDLTIHYGLGFELLRFSDSKETLAAKNGVIPGFSSWYVFFPDKKLALAASANNEKAVLPLLLLIRDVASSFR